MFHKRTVLIVGAGASCELGFPSGQTLLVQIEDMLQLNREAGRGRTRERMVDAVKSIAGGTTDEFYRLQAAAHRIVTAAAVGRSIDNILEQHEDDERVLHIGKMAIVCAILQAENQSRLRPAGKPLILSDVGSLRDTWHYKFGQMLTEGLSRQRAEDIFSNISIICFNYDRAIEHYLPFHISVAWGIDLESARSLTKRLHIIHPYGQVGPLPWMNKPDSIDFGETQADYNKLSRQILTFSERIDDEDVMSDMSGMISSAHQIIFLGFGFHKQNIELICPTSGTAETAMATVYEASFNEKMRIMAQVKRFVRDSWVKPDPILDDLPCQKFLSDSWGVVLG